MCQRLLDAPTNDDASPNHALRRSLPLQSRSGTSIELHGRVSPDITAPIVSGTNGIGNEAWSANARPRSISSPVVLRRIRQDHGLSQERLAHMTDLNTTHVAKIERSEREPESGPSLSWQPPWALRPRSCSMVSTDAMLARPTPIAPDDCEQLKSILSPRSRSQAIRAQIVGCPPSL